MDNERIFEKLEELSLGQQRIEFTLKSHLEDHNRSKEETQLKFDRITKMYLPIFGTVVASLHFILNWFNPHYTNKP